MTKIHQTRTDSSRLPVREIREGPTYVHPHDRGQMVTESYGAIEGYWIARSYDAVARSEADYYCEMDDDDPEIDVLGLAGGDDAARAFFSSLDWVRVPDDE